jgi:tetratricopeptide (TPR) repeat protein
MGSRQHGDRVLYVQVAFVLWGVGASGARGEVPVERFIAHLRTETEFSAEAVELIRTTWSECQDCDGEEFLTQGLTLLSETFRAGLDAYDAERYDECARIMARLRSDKDAFIAANASAYEIKALVANEQLLEASERIEALIGERARAITELTYFAPELAFLRGYCLLADLQYRKAREVLERFLAAYPDAPQRLTLAAQQMLAELEHRQSGRIGEVVDLMTFAGRRLTHHDTGETVQQRQTRVVEILDRLIQEAEQQENSSNNSSSSSGSQGRQPKSQQTPQNPMQESVLPAGEAQGGALQDTRRVNPGEVWGSMPEAQRERILQALRDTFPRRYRRLVEQYYEQLGKGP